MWVSLLVTHLGLWDWCFCPKCAFCCFWPCRKPPERKPFCERLPPGATGPPLPSRMPSDTSSTWNENVYDDVEVPEYKKSYIYVHNRDGLAEVSYESVPDQDSVETTTSRGNQELAVSRAEKDDSVVPAEKSKNVANSTKRSPGSEEEHIYEDIDAVSPK